MAIFVGQLSPAAHPSPVHTSGTGSRPTALRQGLAPPAIEAGLEPWLLNSPLNRPVTLPAANGRSLIVAGGIYGSGSSTQGVYEVNPLTGQASQIGNLQAPLHDAAAAVIGGRGYVFGGGVSQPLAGAQQLAGLSPSGQGANTPLPVATSLASLPQARADGAAVSIGSTAYIVGGYNGVSGDSSVLATSNGRSYHSVANLPVPVRYPAVAASGGRIYVFGGDATSGPRSGLPVSTVQMINPATGRASVVGSLPRPLAGAAAATLGGTIYVAGGETATATGGSSSLRDVSSIYAWAQSDNRPLFAGRLFTPVSHAGVAVLGTRAWLVGGDTAPGTSTAAVQMFEPNRGFGTAGRPGAGSPYYGDTLLIADRGNNRLLALNDLGKITWRYPSATRPPPPGGFYFPDDAFFTHHGTAIISNQELNETVVQIAYPSGKLLWTYGHPRQPGSLPGYLNNPDDAYLLKNGNVTVADPMNCRVLIISPQKKILTQIGTPGTCVHQPPKYLGSPNGDTPLPNGNLLVSEINGSWVDEFTQSGKLIWSVHLPIGYPSDPQRLGPDKYLIANYQTPGGFLEFNRAGKILYRYSPSSGTGALNMPSLVEMLPSGVLMANDDHNDRIVAIDPATNALVWQYGKTGVKGTAPGLLNTPDGFDLLGPHGTFPTHPATG
ncbi:MAG: hypothetical protein ACYDBS_06205 [Acidimicrobiales bacterium]